MRHPEPAMSNPLLNETRWDHLATMDGPAVRSTTMTVNGAIGKTLLLLVLMGAAIGGMWHAFWGPDGVVPSPLLNILMIGGAIAGLIQFTPAWATRRPSAP